MGIYHYGLSGQWLPGIVVTHQWPLFDVESTEILNMSGLPAGRYVFSFGVDTVQDGVLSMPEMYSDSVVVDVQE
jgi:hypothetical protein